LQGDSITSPRQDKDQTHAGVVDHAAVHKQDRHHQASDTVDIIGVSAERLEDVPHPGRTKEPWETNCRGVLSAAHPRHKHAPLLVTERSSKTRFLVDMGADVSVVPVLPQNRCNKSKFTLSAVNGTPIATFGQKLLQLDFWLRHNFQWPFHIAEVSKPILGTDFLSYFNLLVDIRQGKLMDGNTNQKVPGQIANISALQLSCLDSNVAAQYCDLLSDFPSLTRNSIAPKGIQHGISHTIITQGQPVTAKTRRLAPETLKATKLEFEFMLHQGLCRPSKSCWASPLHLVLKKNGDWRPCGDYRKLNAITQPDYYPILFLDQDCVQFLHGTIFSTIDLIHAYQQISVKEEDIPKMAIITPFGLYEFPFITFGLHNAAQTFQRFTDEVLRGLDFCYIYLDNIFVASKNAEEHYEHLWRLFQRFQQFGVAINTTKCVFRVEVSFLGYFKKRTRIFVPESGSHCQIPRT